MTTKNFDVFNVCLKYVNFKGKVEKILKDSLDWIPAPSTSVKIQNMGRKGLKSNIAGCCQQTFEENKFVDNAQQCFAFMSHRNFPAHNLKFH